MVKNVKKKFLKAKGNGNSFQTNKNAENNAHKQDNSEIPRKSLLSRKERRKKRKEKETFPHEVQKDTSRDVSGGKPANKLTSKLEQFKAKLDAGRFRFLNEQLYTTTGAESFEYFTNNPDSYWSYHKGFAQQVEKWPNHPLTIIINWLKKQKESKAVYDLGCGEAKIAEAVGHQHKILSFDFVAANEYVTVADMAHLPVENESADIVIFCLSLMGTNIIDFIKEARRVLKNGGTMKIAEVSSRFYNVKRFCEAVCKLGFKQFEREVYDQLTSIPKFYATLPYFSSPFEISVQPKFLNKTRMKLEEKMQQSYTISATSFEEIELFEQMPCAMKEQGVWYRGKIISINKNKTSAVVLKVDYGVDKIVFLPDIRPLLIQYGRIPPLILKCRVKDVFVNDLDTSKIDQFRKLICDIGNLVRVEICNNQEPYSVNLFHPTIDNENLGKAFYRPPDHAAHEEAKHRKWLEHKRRQENDNDSDFDDDDSDDVDEEEEPAATYIQSFGKCSKLPFGQGETMTVVHVENSKIIYLRSKWMETGLAGITSALNNGWDSFPLFSSDAVLPGTACAVCSDSKLFRAVLESNDDDGFTVFLLDYGRYIKTSLSCLRIVPYQEPFIESPMMYVVSLNRDYRYFPHPSESICLKELLPVGTEVSFSELKTKNKIPAVGLLEYSNKESVDQLLESMLKQRRVYIESREIVPYDGHRNGMIDLAFIHRLRCNQALLKGKITEAHLSQF